MFNNTFPHFRFIEIIIEINLAARDEVEPLSNIGFNSTISAALIFLSFKETIMSCNSREVIPIASGLPTPGAKAGSKTSRSMLT
ncbi:MAG: hypothetical protein Ct9H300mP17_03530 [Candidatus Nitrosopelagicus sp.]|nr:MAG: hypothetical protein Ct9H300mP17_03530 [Candidatus Nitrosopelagicus sp.]